MNLIKALKVNSRARIPAIHGINNNLSCSIMLYIMVVIHVINNHVMPHSGTGKLRMACDLFDTIVRRHIRNIPSTNISLSLVFFRICLSVRASVVKLFSAIFGISTQIVCGLERLARRLVGTSCQCKCYNQKHNVFHVDFTFLEKIEQKLAVVFLNQYLAYQRGSTLRPFFRMCLKVIHDLINKIAAWVTIGTKIYAFFKAIVNSHNVAIAIKTAILSFGVFSRRTALGIKGSTSIGAREWCCVVDRSKDRTRSQYARSGYDGNYKIHLRCFSGCWLRAWVLGFNRSIYGYARVFFLKLRILFKIFYDSFHRCFKGIKRQTNGPFFSQIIFGCHDITCTINSHVSVSNITGHSPKLTIQINSIDYFYPSFTKVINKATLSWKCARIAGAKPYKNNCCNKSFDLDISLIACTGRLSKIADAVKFRITVSTPASGMTKQRVYL